MHTSTALLRFIRPPAILAASLRAAANANSRKRHRLIHQIFLYRYSLTHLVL
jgi:hypothetical protein